MSVSPEDVQLALDSVRNIADQKQRRPMFGERGPSIAAWFLGGLAAGAFLSQASLREIVTYPQVTIVTPAGVAAKRQDRLDPTAPLPRNDVPTFTIKPKGRS